MIDKIKKDERKSDVKELLYADEVVRLGNNWQAIEIRYARSKKAMTEKDLTPNVKKTKTFCTNKGTVAIEISKLSWSVCRRGVARNFMHQM